MPLRNSVSSVSIKFYREEITQPFCAHNNLDLLLALHHPSLNSKLRFQKGGDSKWEFQSRSVMKDKLSIHIPLQTYYWPYNTHFPFHPIHITPSLLCFFALHRDIITQPHFYHCYIPTSQSIFHLSSFRLQSISFISFRPQSISLIIHFLYHSPSHSHLPYLVTLISSHCHSTLLSLPPFIQSRLWKLTTQKCLLIKFDFT